MTQLGHTMSAPPDLADTFDHAMKLATERREMLDAIWANCTVIFWPSLDDQRGDYPMEHNPRARKDMRVQIEARLKELLSDDREVSK